MRTRRSIAYVALLAVALTAPSAMAATKRKPAPKPKPVCHLITDVANDSGPNTNGFAGTPAQASVYDQSLDITGGDIASDGKIVTAVIRVAKLTMPDNSAPTGRHWQLTLQDGNTAMAFNAYDGPAGHFASPGTAVFDTTKNEIRISAPASQLPASVKVGTILSDFNLTSQLAVVSPESAAQYVGPATIPPGATEDYASAPATLKYKVGTPSCVALGK